MPTSDLREMNYTPGPLWTQIGQHIEENGLIKNPKLVLDPSAGSGAAAQRLRGIWPDAKYHGLELRKEEKKYLGRHFDRFALKPWRDERTFSKWGKFDLIITNPPFPLWVHFVETLLLRLKKNGILVLLGLLDWGARNTQGSTVDDIVMRSAVDLFKKVPPRYCLRIPGTVSFRPHAQRDTRSYGWWVWEETINETGSWESYNLDLLPAKDRRWIIPPGRDHLFVMKEGVESKNQNGRVKRAVKALTGLQGKPRIIGSKRKTA